MTSQPPSTGDEVGVRALTERQRGDARHLRFPSRHPPLQEAAWPSALGCFEGPGGQKAHGAAGTETRKIQGRRRRAHCLVEQETEEVE